MDLNISNFDQSEGQTGERGVLTPAPLLSSTSKGVESKQVRPDEFSSDVADYGTPRTESRGIMRLTLSRCSEKRKRESPVEVKSDDKDRKRRGKEEPIIPIEISSEKGKEEERNINAKKNLIYSSSEAESMSEKVKSTKSLADKLNKEKSGNSKDSSSEKETGKKIGSGKKKLPERKRSIKKAATPEILIRKKNKIELMELNTSDLLTIGIDTLILIDDERVKSTNLNGGVSANIFKCLVEVMGILKALAYQAESKGELEEVELEKKKSKVLREKIEETKIEIENSRKKNGILKERIAAMEEKIIELEGREIDLIQEQKERIKAIKRNIKSGKEDSLKVPETRTEKEDKAERKQEYVFDSIKNRKAKWKNYEERRYSSRTYENNKFLKRTQNSDSEANEISAGRTTSRLEKPKITENKLLGRSMRVRVMDNVESEGTSSPSEWRMVIGKKARMRRGPENMDKKDTPRIDGHPSRTIRRRAPKTAAVSIVTTQGGPTPAEILAEARNKIPASDLQGLNPRVRKGLSGATIIEIPGPDGKEKAIKLEKELNNIFPNGIKISRPEKRGEIRLVGLDESVAVEEIAETLATITRIRKEEIRIGGVRTMRGGLSMAWATCPLETAILLASKNKVRIGWNMAKVELMEARKPQCYKCWEYGHVRFGCKSSIDRRGRCFNCGGDGHSIKQCKEKSTCLICRNKNLDFNHKIGSYFCESAKQRTVERIRLNNHPPSHGP